MTEATYRPVVGVHNAAKVMPHKSSRVMCSEACAEMLGLDDAWRFDPCVLRAAVGAKP